jgi:hypothetical protein
MPPKTEGRSTQIGLQKQVHLNLGICFGNTRSDVLRR